MPKVFQIYAARYEYISIVKDRAARSKIAIKAAAIDDKGEAVQKQTTRFQILLLLICSLALSSCVNWFGNSPHQHNPKLTLHNRSFSSAIVNPQPPEYGMGCEGGSRTLFIDLAAIRNRQRT